METVDGSDVNRLLSKRRRFFVASIHGDDQGQEQIHQMKVCDGIVRALDLAGITSQWQKGNEHEPNIEND